MTSTLRTIRTLALLSLSGVITLGCLKGAAPVVYDTTTGRITSPTNLFILNNFVKMGISNIVSADPLKLDIGTNNGTLWLTNLVSGGGGGTGVFSIGLNDVVTGDVSIGSVGVFSISVDSVVTGNVIVQ